MLCDVFSSRRKADTYLYLQHGADFDDVPEALRESFGPPTKVLTVNLAKRDQLARISSADLIKHLKETGFYLQLSPQQESLK
ncbi:hypothetical protein C5610_09035 [Idiomarina sp. OT37-5b]|uniref:YcgL domain-containing protein n=1 Tax=Idiomarina sp. OT37-5b TaxID=2100422 RepID=UPI000CFA481A|nr:YcgL domain-containing protein [Idiomarina sp. OT37-5b]AVJ56426.1 hypothetical protein C5610_09035 [Idiomarina sp. OT37-5b]